MKQLLTAEHLGITLAERSEKPRKRGITMCIDSGDTWQSHEGVLEAWSDYIDVMKLTVRHLFQPLDALKKKIDVLRKYNVEVQPGGVIVEIARFQHQEEGFLKKLKDLGFTQIEVSATTSERHEMEEDAKFTQLAKKLGLTVFGEIGKKMLDGDSTRIDDVTLDVQSCIEQSRRLLDAGADRVYFEGHVLRRVMGDTASDILKKQSTGTKQVQEIVDAIGLDRLVFECSAMCPRKTRRAMHFWFVHQFGPEVNVGNVRPSEVSTLEDMRRGLYPVFGFGPAGDHPWIRSISMHDGTATKDWQREFPLQRVVDPLSE